MQSFLPSGYSFSPDRLVYEKTFQYFTTENRDLLILAGIICIVCIPILALYIRFGAFQGQAVIGFIILAAFLVGSGVYDNYKNDQKLNQYNVKYVTSIFKYPIKSNLTITGIPNAKSNHLNTPKNTKDRKVYPYKLYANEKVYLGIMQNGNFKPANNYEAKIFDKYYTYAIEHNLSSKFTKQIFFKQDKKYLTSDGHIQWILTNNKDTVLHMDKMSNATVEQSNIVKH